MGIFPKIFNWTKQKMEKILNQTQFNFDYLFSNITNSLYLNWKIYLFITCIGSLSIIEYIHICEVIHEMDTILKYHNIKDFINKHTKIVDLNLEDKDSIFSQSIKYVKVKNEKFVGWGSAKEYLEDSGIFDDLENEISKKEIVEVEPVIDLEALNLKVKKARFEIKNIEGADKWKWNIGKSEKETIEGFEKPLKGNLNKDRYNELFSEGRTIIRKFLILANLTTLILLMVFE